MNKKRKKELKFSSDGVTQIPEGYRWCYDCNALTPHVKKESKFFPTCVICDHPSSGSCPNCHAKEPEELGSIHEIINHHEGCHCKVEDNGEFLPISTPAKLTALEFEDQWMSPCPDKKQWHFPEEREKYLKNRKLHKRWEEAYNVECGCPRVTAYTGLNIMNYESRSVYSLDCMNAMEWSYDVRCSICGYIYHMSDGNC